MSVAFRPVCRRAWHCQFCGTLVRKGAPYFEHAEYGDRTKPGAKQTRWTFAECLRCAGRAGRVVPEGT